MSADSADQLETLLISRNFRVSTFYDCHPNGMESLFRVRLSKRTKLLNARTAFTTADNSKRKPVLNKALYLAMLKQTDVFDSAKLSERRTGHKHHPSTVLIFVRWLRLQYVIPYFCEMAQSEFRTSSI